jgi:hypothetical protein
MYRQLLQNAIQYDADISHCGYQMVFPNRIDYYYNTKEIRIQNHKQAVTDLIKADKIEPGLCNKLYRKEVVDGIQLNEKIRINEDLLFNYFAFKKARKAIYEDLPLYHYMVRRNSASTSKVNIHKLEDPLKVIKIIMKQEEGENYCLLEKRYLYLLEKVSSMKLGYFNNKLKKIQRRRKVELRYLLRNKKLKADYSKKELLQLKLAADFPMGYRLLHGIYATLTGSRNKYKV